MLTPWKESYDQPRQHIKKQRHYFVYKGPSSQGYGFSSGHVWMWELDYKESWVLKNWCFWTVVLEKTLESPLDCKEIQPVHPKGDQFWVFIGRTDAEAETPILWPPDAKSWLIGKDPDAGKDWGQRRRGWQRMRWLDGITDSMDMVWVNSGSWWWTGRPGVLWFMGSQRAGHDWMNWTELKWYYARNVLSVIIVLAGHILVTKAFLQSFHLILTTMSIKGYRRFLVSSFYAHAKWYQNEHLPKEAKPGIKHRSCDSTSKCSSHDTVLLVSEERGESAMVGLGTDICRHLWLGLPWWLRG